MNINVTFDQQMQIEQQAKADTNIDIKAQDFFNNYQKLRTQQHEYIQYQRSINIYNL